MNNIASYKSDTIHKLPAKHARFYFILFVLLVSPLRQDAQTQVNNHRLIGTSYHTYSDVLGWEPQDSTRLTYPGFSNTMVFTPIPRYHMVMQDRIPITYPDLTFYETGFYTGGDYFLISITNYNQYDTLFRYTYGTQTPDTWESDGYYSRIYLGNMLSMEQNHYKESSPIDSIVTAITYNESNQIIKIVYISLNLYTPGIDTSGIWDFFYTDNRLSMVKYRYRFFDEMILSWENHIAYNALGQAESETEHLYYSINQPTSGRKHVYDYYADGSLHHIYTQRQSDGTWYDIEKEEFGYEDGNPAYYFASSRSMDSVAHTFSDWDTTYLINYYHTGDRIDSVIQQTQIYNGNLKTMHKEYFTYSNNLLQTYTMFSYAWTRYLTQHYFTYDSLDLLVQQHIEYSDTIYQNYTVIDEFYTYDAFYNMRSKEIWQGNDDAGIDLVVTEPQSKTLYTYALQHVAGSVDDDLYIHVYPSPANTTITIEAGLQHGGDTDLEIEIYSASGSRVFIQTVPITDNGAFLIDCSGWASGVYVVQANTSENTVHQNIVVY